MADGYFGLYYDEAEKFLLMIIKKYQNNKIIILPSSFYISIDSNITNLISTFNNSKLTIFARDQISFLNFKKYFNNINIFKCPDIVLYLKNYFEIPKSNDKILVISRNDNEIKYSELNTMKFGEHFSNIINTKLQNYDFYEFQQILKDYLIKLNQAKYILTDTLHISIFAYLLNIDCYSLDNKYGKIKNTITEYMQNSSVKYIGNIDNNVNISNIDFSKLKEEISL